MSSSPGGWARAPIPALISGDGVFLDGDWVESKDQDPNGGVRLIQLADVGDGRYLNRSNRFLTESKAIELSCTMLNRGDVLIARMPDPLGRACMFPGDTKSAVTVVDVCVIRGRPEHFDPSWLMYFINAPEFRGDMDGLQSGTTRKRISRGNLSTLNLPIPPRSEQSRIVAKLEELLSDLDAGVAELKAAQRKLALYRQSLLKAAVEGALTADWRARNPPTETGAQLLERILQQRRARWEARQLARFKEQGKAPPKDWRALYPQPKAADVALSEGLPSGWHLATLGQLVDVLTSGSRDWSPYYGKGASVFVMAQNVRPWRPDFSFRQLIDPPIGHRDRARSEINRDDLLITIVGANTGQVCRVSDDLRDHFVCQSVALIRLVETGLAEYVNAVLNSPAHGQKQFDAMNYGAGRPHLSFEQLESVLVPLPPLDEQMEILEVLANDMSTVTDAVSQVDHVHRQSSAQRKNILQAAFSGRLVPQDPSDEPASVLLARIRAERAAQAGNQSKTRRNTTRGRRKAAPSA